MIGFSNTLINVLAIKNVITQSEAAAPNSRNNRAKQEEAKPKDKANRNFDLLGLTYSPTYIYGLMQVIDPCLFSPIFTAIALCAYFLHLYPAVSILLIN